MTFRDFKSNINIIADCEELQGWEFDKILTSLQNVVLDLDKIKGSVDKE